MDVDNSKYDSLSNSELNIQMKKLEHTYVKTQTDIKKLLNNLSQIDKEYIIIQNILNKRKKMFAK